MTGSTAKLMVLLSATQLAFSVGARAEGVPEEFRVKREAVFEFARPPRVARKDGVITIQFETRGFCDVAVAIEDSDGRIVRHLASGVLGDNALPPLAKQSKAQTLIWDLKNDRGDYVREHAGLKVRVSLGLKP